MCGISGIVMLDGSPAPAETVQRMTRTLAHRGPDDAGMHLSGPVALGFRRLSILDLTPSGHQPMSTSDGSVTIVFNGEIYNYVELRAQLEAKGHRFTSSGDTEVLLRAYCEWGAQCLPKLNGMWAFLIHDRRRHVIFGSRDRFGIKPLFRYRAAGAMLLASEIKAIRASGLYASATNWRTAARFLVQSRLDDTPETFYEGIVRVGAGTAFEIDPRGNYREWPFWSLDEIAKSPVAEPAEAFAELFEDAVRLHMRSDVPVGVSLSGGLDSTSIMCASARIRAADGAKDDLQAICYITPEYDETNYIMETVRQTGARLRTLDATPQTLWSDFERMLWFQDEPVHAMPALIGYQLMKLAAGHGLKVMLNGQGADETIGGYPSYFCNYWHTLLSTRHPLRTWREIDAFVAGHGGGRAALTLQQLRRLAQARLGEWGPYRALRQVYRRLTPADPWFTPELSARLPVGRDGNEAPPDLDGVLMHDVTCSPLPLYLRVEDRNSMAHSIEARLPFLDYRLVTLMFTLGPEWRLRGQWNKYVLRQGMRGRIPELVRSRVLKMGFPVPWREWAAKDLYGTMHDIINSRQARERGIYRTQQILRDFERYRRGEGDFSSRMFNTIGFELWAGMESRALA
jgi:asparagine synthase (glutamine-hydrolysing)